MTFQTRAADAYREKVSLLAAYLQTLATRAEYEVSEPCSLDLNNRLVQSGLIFEMQKTIAEISAAYADSFELALREHDEECRANLPTAF